MPVELVLYAADCDDTEVVMIDSVEVFECAAGVELENEDNVADSILIVVVIGELVQLLCEHTSVDKVIVFQDSRVAIVVPLIVLSTLMTACRLSSEAEELEALREVERELIAELLGTTKELTP